MPYERAWVRLLTRCGFIIQTKTEFVVMPLLFVQHIVFPHLTRSIRKATIGVGIADGAQIVGRGWRRRSREQFMTPGIMQAGAIEPICQSWFYSNKAWEDQNHTEQAQ